MKLFLKLSNSQFIVFNMGCGENVLNAVIFINLNVNVYRIIVYQKKLNFLV